VIAAALTALSRLALLYGVLTPFVGIKGAADLIATGAAVLDARGASAPVTERLPRAVSVDLAAMLEGPAPSGTLTADVGRLARLLAQAGVDDARPVLVYGAADRGLGEEGRLAWILAYLGHPDVHILDGGVRAWAAARRPFVPAGAAPAPGRFTASVRESVRAKLPDLGVPGAVLLDVRTDEEWRGARKYGEARGGHLPGARHVPWTRLLDDAGRVRSPDEVRAVLLAAGIGPRDRVITYCTGGVRSAFAWAVLTSAGFGVRNYDASLYEWARTSRPLVTGP
jgi:thiosulfate/3-mercaptopyruvate sulfurtransferase